jgi:hypothetical protein
MTDDVLEAPDESADERQERRIAELPIVYKTRLEQLAYEIALGAEDTGPIFMRYGYTQEQAINLLADGHFAKMLERVTKDVRENGLSFRSKARLQAEELLQHSFNMATDENVNPSVRADIIKWTAKVGGLEPKEKDEGKAAGGGFTLNLTFAGQSQQAVVSHEPITIEAER